MIINDVNSLMMMKTSPIPQFTKFAYGTFGFDTQTGEFIYNTTSWDTRRATPSPYGFSAPAGIYYVTFNLGSGFQISIRTFLGNVSPSVFETADDFTTNVTIPNTSEGSIRTGWIDSSNTPQTITLSQHENIVFVVRKGTDNQSMSSSDLSNAYNHFSVTYVP